MHETGAIFKLSTIHSCHMLLLVELNSFTKGLFGWKEKKIIKEKKKKRLN